MCQPWRHDHLLEIQPCIWRCGPRNGVLQRDAGICASRSRLTRLIWPPSSKGLPRQNATSLRHRRKSKPPFTALTYLPFGRVFFKVRAKAGRLLWELPHWRVLEEGKPDMEGASAKLGPSWSPVLKLKCQRHFRSL